MTKGKPMDRLGISRKQGQKMIREIQANSNLDPVTGALAGKGHDCYDDQRRPSEANDAEIDARWDLAFGKITQEEFNKLKENNYGV